MNKWFIDRFEGSFAICENTDGYRNTILKSLLPKEAQEGDCIIEQIEGDCTSYKLDQMETQMRKQEIKKRLNNLFE